MHCYEMIRMTEYFVPSSESCRRCRLTSGLTKLFDIVPPVQAGGSRIKAIESCHLSVQHSSGPFLSACFLRGSNSMVEGLDQLEQWVQEEG